ncbi:MAG TPA: hypothetical protein VGF48_06985 [Thermoanaerobaculia bacterium]|jgi:hypothetical protein
MAEKNHVTLSHEERAPEMVARVMAILVEYLPELTGISKGQRRRLTNAASVPDEFLEQIAVSVDQSPGVGSIHDLTADEAREMIVFSRVYNAAGEQIVQLGHSVMGVVTERRYDVGQRALGVYGTVKSANRPNRKATVSNVAALRRALGRTRGRRTAAEPASDTPVAVTK